MRVLFLGGSGEFGLPTCGALAGLAEIEEVIIGTRNVARGQVAARQCGAKVRAMRLDATDEDTLARAMQGVDFVLNMAGQETRLPAVRGREGDLQGTADRARSLRGFCRPCGRAESRCHRACPYAALAPVHLDR